jgi:hypothetical protein
MEVSKVTIPVEIEKNLLAAGYRRLPDPAYEAAGINIYVKRELVLSKLSFVETFFTFAHFNGPTHNELTSLSSAAFARCMNLKINPLPCGCFSGVECYAVAIVEDINEEVCNQVKCSTPPEHIAASEMLVLLSPTSNQITFFEGTPFWGAMYWEGRRDLVRRMIRRKEN